MKQIEIMNTAVKVSPLCLGTWTFGNPIRENEGINLVQWCLDEGLNFFDTADMYEGYDRKPGTAGGLAEEILGKALHNRRHRAVVTTKVGNAIGGAGYEGSGLGQKHILHQIDASLRRLQMDCVDFYELHRDDPDTPLEEPLAVMAKLISTGKVRHWGFSNFAADRIAQMIRICNENSFPPPVIAQPQYNWLERSVEADFLPLCLNHEIAVTPYQPLHGGLLTGKYQRGQSLPTDSRAAEHPPWLKIDENMFDELEEFEKEAVAVGLTPSQYALRWVLSRPGISAVVVGAKRKEQLQELIKACNQE